MPLTPEEIGARLRARREYLGLTQAEVAAEIGVHRPTISQIEAGRRTLTVRELLRLARVYVTTPTALLAERPPAEGEIERALLRGRADDAPALRRAKAHLLQRFRAERELEGLLGRGSRPDPRPAYALPAPADRDDALRQGEALAGQERRRLGLGPHPIRDPLALLECQGLRLTPLTEPGLRVHALYFEGADLGACLGLAAPAGPRDVFRTTFTAAHAYAHWLLRDVRVEAFRYDGATEDLLEVRANAFAAAFLMPREGAERYLREMGLLNEGRIERMSPGDLVHAMNQFGLFRPALVRRLGDLGLLPEDEHDRLLRLEFSVTGVARKLGVRLHEYRDVDVRLRRLVRHAWRRGKITTGRAAELLELDIEDFRYRMRQLGEVVVEDAEDELPLVGAAAG